MATRKSKKKDQEIVEEEIQEVQEESVEDEKEMTKDTEGPESKEKMIKETETVEPKKETSKKEVNTKPTEEPKPNQVTIFTSSVTNAIASEYVSEITSSNPNGAVIIRNFNKLLRSVVNQTKDKEFENLLKFFITYKDSILVEKSALQGINSVSKDVPTLSINDKNFLVLVYTVMRYLSTDTVPKKGLDLEKLTKVSGSEKFVTWVNKKIS